MTSIIFVGFMGAGKTTIGKVLSEKLGKTFIDFDEWLVNELKMSIADFFKQFGELEFRKKETELLMRLTDADAVISTGGGIVLKEHNRQLLSQFKPVIYLKAEPNVFINRLRNDLINVRPLIIEKNAQEIIELFVSRGPLYEEVANYVIDTSQKTPEQIVQEIINQVGE